jgi:hypothetical protein
LSTEKIGGLSEDVLKIAARTADWVVFPADDGPETATIMTLGEAIVDQVQWSLERGLS